MINQKPEHGDMKSRLLESLSVLSFIAALIFVPYWICKFTKPVTTFEDEATNVILTWVIGIGMISGFLGIIAMLITWIRWIITGQKY
jgi:hypothetical protein